MIQIHPERTAPPLRQPWRTIITVGRAYELLRQELQDHLRSAQADIGWEYCRFHGLFHDDMNVALREEDGTLRFQWHHIDKVIDSLLGMGLRPFVELNPMPSCMARGKTTMFFYQMNVCPPQNWGEWSDLVTSFAEHCIQRYGLEEVRTWYFELWNEPNFPCFWDGTKEEYFELYRHTALPLKEIDPELRVGGPATAQAAWIPEMIEFCVTNQVPIDFVSTHSYPQDESVFYPDLKDSPHKPGEFFFSRFEKVRSEVAASSRPDLEIHWTEWNAVSSASGEEVSWTENPHIDGAFAGSFAVKQCLELDGLCDGMGWWVISDIFEEAGIPNAPFSSTYGLMTIHGLPKASCHAFHFLARLRGDRIQLSQETFPHGCGAIAVKDHNTIRLMVWNHPALHAPDKPMWVEQFALPFSAVPTTLHTATVSPACGSGYEAWQRMGKPHDPTPFEMEILRAQSQPAYRSCFFEKGASATLDVEIEAYSFLFAEYSPAGPNAFGKGNRSLVAEEADVEDQLSGK